MNDVRREVMRAICDTVCPPLERADDPDGFWSRSGSDVGAPEALAEAIAGLPPLQREGLEQLLDGLARMGFLGRLAPLARAAPAQPAGARAGRRRGRCGADDARAVPLLRACPTRRPAATPSGTRSGTRARAGCRSRRRASLTPLVPEGDDAQLEADAVIVGTGAGGGVIAAALARAGQRVLLLDMGGLFDESDFNQYELWAYQNLYWRGGPNPTADMNVSLYAGSSFGGGTTINWTNCLRTKPWVREQWAREHGLEGLDTAEFDRHLDAVWERLSVTDRCSHLNGTQESMKRGADALGWSFKTITRNVDESRYTPETAGFIGFGDQTGAKQSTAKTYLADAVAHGAEVIVRCFAERILTEGGRAAGVGAVYSDPETGRSARVSIRAPRVVVACGALESPALLLRSGIGGPAVGHNLRLHPCTATTGSYLDDQRAWWGAPQAALVDEFANVEDGHGFLIESTQYAPGTAASATPFAGGETHKRLMQQLRYGATFIGLVRDHGGGRVTIDADGQALPMVLARRPARRREHPPRAGRAGAAARGGGRARDRGARGRPAAVARRRRRRALPRAARARAAARRGLQAFRGPPDGHLPHGQRIPQTSVAGPWGELHDTPGVWIGDASAFPTSSGTNPMITIMALAHRTGEAIVAASPAAATATA